MKHLILVFLLIVCAQTSTAQIPVSQLPPVVRELDTLKVTGLGSWKLPGNTHLFITAAGDSARVYFDVNGLASAVYVKLWTGERYLKSSVFGWFQVTTDFIASYNAIQEAPQTAWNYLGNHPLELFTHTAMVRDGVTALPDGILPPRPYLRLELAYAHARGVRMPVELRG